MALSQASLRLRKGVKLKKAKNTSNVAALYVRISRDDDNLGESNSITMQKKLLTKAATEKGYSEQRIYCDDGITGTTDKRPEFQKMLKDIENGNISAVFVKDTSRLTRDQVTFLDLIRKFFPKHNVRFVSVADGTDTDEREDELAPFRGLVSEMYAQDISKKRRATNKVKGLTEPLSPPPYGYIKPSDSKRWEVDPEAAAVVRRMFKMRIDGAGTEQIAAAFSAEGILNPSAYFASKGIRRNGRQSVKEPTHWNHSTVIKMLSQQEYCGDIINFKTYSKSFFLKERIPSPPDMVHVIPDAHEPIIERHVFEQVQSMTTTRSRVRKTKDGERNIFSGLLTCPECGRNLHYRENAKNRDIKYFSCSNSKANRGTCEDTHYVRVDFLEQVLLAEIRRLTRFAKEHEEEFAELVMGLSLKSSKEERDRKQKAVYAKNARIRDIDKLIERIYEDNVNGKLSDERFSRMSANYETEQGTLMQEVRELNEALSQEEISAVSTEDFIKIVRKYTRAKKLTPTMLHELIDHIDVYPVRKEAGKKT